MEYKSIQMKESWNGSLEVHHELSEYYQNSGGSNHSYPYHIARTIKVLVQPKPLTTLTVDKTAVEGYVPSYGKRALEAVLVQRKTALMQCDPPLITSVPGYLAYAPPPPPPDNTIKDELVQRQEEFIIECMYPKRILPSNVKLREDNRPLSPSRIPGIKLSMREIYGPERSPPPKRNYSLLNRRSPTPIRWRRIRSESRERYRSRTRSKSSSPINSDKTDSSQEMDNDHSLSNDEDSPKPKKIKIKTKYQRIKHKSRSPSK